MPRCRLWKQVLAPMGTVLKVWGLALELNLELNHVLQQNSLPHPGPLIQVALWTEAPSAFLGTSLRRASQDSKANQLGVGKDGKRRGYREAKGWDRVKEAKFSLATVRPSHVEKIGSKAPDHHAALSGRQGEFSTPILKRKNLRLEVSKGGLQLSALLSDLRPQASGLRVRR